MSYIPKKIEPFPVYITAGPFEGEAGEAVDQYPDGVFGIDTLNGDRAFARDMQIHRITKDGPMSELTKLEDMGPHGLLNELTYWVKKISKSNPVTIADLVEGSGGVEVFIHNSLESMKNGDGEAEVIETIRSLMEDADV